MVGASISTTATQVLVGLGSNLGDSEAIVEAALAELRGMSCGFFRASSLWRTSPVCCPPGSAHFVNAAAAFASAAPSPLALLQECKALERRYGRGQPAARNAPRALDVDLLLFGQCIMRSDRLTLPHPRALSRRFVMTPAAEAAPDWAWAGTGRSIAELSRALATDETLTRLMPRAGSGAGEAR